jgi:hypothetical protein
MSNLANIKIETTLKVLTDRCLRFNGTVCLSMISPSWDDTQPSRFEEMRSCRIFPADSGVNPIYKLRSSRKFDVQKETAMIYIFDILHMEAKA